ncbi:MAG: hypothetical protein LBV80_04085 [Deltaproteobacteria bacterium]|jgi:predicted transposase/invertase (TIGR01784 family)|nr:hypothetical protein [Deltaproteobacteria bacterium]
MNVARTSPAINEAWGVIKVLSGDEQARALAEAREKHLMDMASYMDDARYEGRQKEKLDIAQKLLLKKMPHEDVADATGLSLENVKSLAPGLIQ